MVATSTKVQIESSDMERLISVVTDLGKRIDENNKSTTERFEEKLSAHIDRTDREFDVLAKNMAETNQSMKEMCGQIGDVVSEMRTSDAERNNLIGCLKDMKDDTKKNTDEIHEIDRRLSIVETKQEDRYGWQAALMKMIMPVLIISMLGLIGFLAKAYLA